MSRRRDPVTRVRTDHGLAELVPDPDRAQAWTLLVDGTAQSHVDLADPTYLEFEYVRWLARVADLVADPGRPLGVLHLGGGAWTLARYVAATRPGSRQRVVERDAGLVRVVRDHLPARVDGVRVRIGDAREVLSTVAPGSVDLLVVDVFAGARTPAHLTSDRFVADAARVLRPGGTYLANLADGDRLAFTRGQVATASSVFADVALVSFPQILRGRRFGNLVVAARGHPGPPAWDELHRRLLADPFPAHVVSGADLARFAAGAAVVTDATAVASPPPPAGLHARRDDPVDA